VSPARASRRREQLGGGGVGEVAVAATDALLERPGAFRVGFEEFGAVVGLDNEDVGFGELCADIGRRVAEVGQ